MAPQSAAGCSWDAVPGRDAPVDYPADRANPLHRALAVVMAKVGKRKRVVGEVIKTTWPADYYFGQEGKRHNKTFGIKREAETSMRSGLSMIAGRGPTGRASLSPAGLSARAAAGRARRRPRYTMHSFHHAATSFLIPGLQSQTAPDPIGPLVDSDDLRHSRPPLPQPRRRPRDDAKLQVQLVGE